MLSPVTRATAGWTNERRAKPELCCSFGAFGASGVWAARFPFSRSLLPAVRRKQFSKIPLASNGLRAIHHHPHNTSSLLSLTPSVTSLLSCCRPRETHWQPISIALDDNFEPAIPLPSSFFLFFFSLLDEKRSSQSSPCSQGPACGQRGRLPASMSPRSALSSNCSLLPGLVEKDCRRVGLGREHGMATVQLAICQDNNSNASRF